MTTKHQSQPSLRHIRPSHAPSLQITPLDKDISLQRPLAAIAISRIFARLENLLNEARHECADNPGRMGPTGSGEGGGEREGGERGLLLTPDNSPKEQTGCLQRKRSLRLLYNDIPVYRRITCGVCLQAPSQPITAQQTRSRGSLSLQ